MFCGKCGTQVPDGANCCPNCGERLGGPAPGPQPAADINKIAIICGAASIVVGLLGSILFGVTCGVIGLIAGVVAIVLSVNIKKTKGDAEGNTAMILGVVGSVVAFIFIIGCLACSGCGGCYGCIGSTCVANQAANDLYRGLGM